MNKINKILNAKVVHLSGSEIAYNGDIKQFRKDVHAYAKQHVRGIYRNQDTGNLIEITNSRSVGGLKEILRHDSFDEDHLLSVTAIPDIIKNGIYIDSLPNEDTKVATTYMDYYICKLEIGNTDYVVKSVVVTMENGKKYYDHKLTKCKVSDLFADIKKGLTYHPSNGQYASPKSFPARAIPSTPLEIPYCKDTRLILILQKYFTQNNSKGLGELAGSYLDLIYHKGCQLIRDNIHWLIKSDPKYWGKTELWNRLFSTDAEIRRWIIAFDAYENTSYNNWDEYDYYSNYNGINRIKDQLHTYFQTYSKRYNALWHLLLTEAKLAAL